MYQVSCYSYVQNEIRQYRMIKGRVAPPKSLFNAVTLIDKDPYYY